MTREEARRRLEGILTEAVEFENSVCYVTEEDREPLEMAIEALEQEPFINKPCVSSGVCEHDKNKILDKIRAEIENMEIAYDKSPNYEDDRTDEEKAVDWFNMNKFLFLQIIDKYKAESEGRDDTDRRL